MARSRVTPVVAMSLSSSCCDLGPSAAGEARVAVAGGGWLVRARAWLWSMRMPGGDTRTLLFGQDATSLTPVQAAICTRGAEGMTRSAVDDRSLRASPASS